MSPEERSQRARIAAYEGWAACPDRQARTAVGTRAFMARFDRMVPDDVTDPDERAKRAEAHRKAYFARLALASAQARRKKKQGKAS